METPAHIAAHHLRVNRQNLQIITNNMANTSTAGYQADRLLVTEYNSPSDFYKSLSFAVDDGTLRDTKPGEFLHTGGSLDAALVTPDVYFALSGQSGEVLYTRNGQFELNKERQIVQSGSGLPVLDESGSEMSVPEGFNDIKIAGDGTLSANGMVVGRLGVFKFPDYKALEKIGNTTMRATSEPEPVGNATILHRGIESSNVNPVLTIAQMIEIQHQDTQDTFVINVYKEQTDSSIDDILKPLNV